MGVVLMLPDLTMSVIVISANWRIGEIYEKPVETQQEK
jgi:hypothetical protein